MAFWVYDVSFLVLFTLFIVWFLYTRKHNLKREGIIFMYRTKFAIKAINYVGDNFKKTLNFLKYIVILTGFCLMAGIIYLISKSLYIYIAFPQITQIIKAPPIAPLIPYFPKLFGLQSFFPDFYFTYFLLALIVVAFVHEFSHGIFMRFFKIKIKSTGVVFLGPILGAFVEEDKKNFQKKKNIEQMTVLAAGTFANVVFALIFFLLLIGFFSVSYQPAGYIFNSYSYSIVPSSSITGIENFSGNLTKIYVNNETYFFDQNLKSQLLANASNLLVYDDSPAVRVGLRGIITQINDIKIKNQEDLRNFLINKNPGDEIKIKTLFNENQEEYDLILAAHPLNNSLGYVGITFIESSSQGIIGSFIKSITSYKNPSTYYQTRYDGDFVEFIYYLLWWIAIINLLVALFNMLPLGILDGGRFFYLTILSITKSKWVAEKSFKIVTYLILAIFLLMILFWFFALF